MKLIDILEAVEKKPLTPEQLAWWNAHIEITPNAQKLKAQKALETALKTGKPFDSSNIQNKNLEIRITFNHKPIETCPIPNEIFEWHFPHAKTGDVIYDDCIMRADDKLLNLGVTQFAFAGRVVIDSLKPLLELTDVEYVNCTNSAEFNCGFLTFLKMKNLKEFRLNSTFGGRPRPQDLACQIINKHLKDKNISECMDELMEAGLKEYAKL